VQPVPIGPIARTFRPAAITPPITLAPPASILRAVLILMPRVRAKIVRQDKSIIVRKAEMMLPCDLFAYILVLIA
jgi:hypothetical protein